MQGHISLIGLNVPVHLIRWRTVEDEVSPLTMILMIYQKEMTKVEEVDTKLRFCRRDRMVKEMDGMA